MNEVQKRFHPHFIYDSLQGTSSSAATSLGGTSRRPGRQRRWWAQRTRRCSIFTTCSRWTTRARWTRRGRTPFTPPQRTLAVDAYTEIWYLLKNLSNFCLHENFSNFLRYRRCKSPFTVTKKNEKVTKFSNSSYCSTTVNEVQTKYTRASYG